MAPPCSPTDSSSVVKLTSTARKLHSSNLPLVRSPEDLHSVPDKFNYAMIASRETKEEFCKPKRARDSGGSGIARRLSAFSLEAVEAVADKRQKFARPSEYISSSSLSAASIAERKLDLTDDDVAFLASYNQTLRKHQISFSEEDFIKAFYKWDVESIKSSIGKGVTKTQRIDSVSAFGFLKPAGVKVPEELFAPLYAYYCRRWDGHQNLPVCRCSWAIIQQLNEYKSLVSSAKLA